jgi:hypothetical protein
VKAGAKLPRVGGVLIIGALASLPQGLIGRVRAVARNADGSALVTTTPATLRQAYSKFRITGERLSRLHTYALESNALGCKGKGIDGLELPGVSWEGDLVKTSFDFEPLRPSLSVLFTGQPTFTANLTIGTGVDCSAALFDLNFPVSTTPPVSMHLQGSIDLSADGKTGVQLTWQPRYAVGINVDRFHVDPIWGFGDSLNVGRYSTRASISLDTSFHADASVASVLSLKGDLSTHLGAQWVAIVNEKSCISAADTLHVGLEAKVDLPGFHKNPSFDRDYGLNPLWQGCFFDFDGAGGGGTPQPQPTPTPTPTPAGAAYPHHVYRTCAAGHCGLALHAAPNLSSAATRTVYDGSTINIVCQTTGETVSEAGYTSAIWDKTDQGDYASDLYVDTPIYAAYSPPIPVCGGGGGGGTRSITISNNAGQMAVQLSSFPTGNAYFYCHAGDPSAYPLGGVITGHAALTISDPNESWSSGLCAGSGNVWIGIQAPDGHDYYSNQTTLVAPGGPPSITISNNAGQMAVQLANFPTGNAYFYCHAGDPSAYPLGGTITGHAALTISDPNQSWSSGLCSGSGNVWIGIQAPDGHDYYSNQTTLSGGGAPTVSLSVGDPASTPTCYINCHYLRVTLNNFAAVTHTVHCNSDWPPPPGEWRSYDTADTTSQVCVFGYSGHNVWVVVDGMQSNTVTWP